MKKNFFYYLLPSILTGLAGLFVIIPISTYYLDPKDFGVIAIITVFSKLVVPFSSVGVSWVLSAHYYKLNQKVRNELIFNMFFVSIILRTFLVLLFAVAGKFFLPVLIKSYQPVFLIYFWIFLAAEWLNGPWEIVSYLIVLQKKGKAHAVLDIVILASRVLFLIICLSLLGLKTVSLAWMYFGGTLAGFIYSLIYIRRYILVKIKFEWIKEIVKRGFLTIPLNVFEQISNSIGRFFIERWVGLSQLGIYSHSLYYRKSFMLPFQAFKKIFSPEILENVSCQNEDKMDKLKTLLKSWFGIIFIGGLFVIMFSKELIIILTHNKFVEATPLVCIWYLIILVYSLGLPYGQFLFANKKTKFIFYSEIIIGVFSWALIAFNVRFFGIEGATISIILYFFILHFTRRTYARYLGCRNFEGSAFIVAILILSILIIFNFYNYSILAKTITFLILSIFGFFYYNLYNVYYNIKLIKNDDSNKFH